MTNTLTWVLRPIQLPKVNSNLLAVISLIVLFTMAFLIGSVIAEHCETERQAVKDAENAVYIAGGYVLAAHVALMAAIASGQWWAVAGLAAAKALAVAHLANESAKLETARRALYDCENEHDPPEVDDSGAVILILRVTF